jgi:hypothetical protein
MLRTPCCAPRGAAVPGCLLFCAVEPLYKTIACGAPCPVPGVSGYQGREGKTNNIVLGSDQTEESWRELDEQVGPPRPPAPCPLPHGSAQMKFVCSFLSAGTMGARIAMLGLCRK